MHKKRSLILGLVFALKLKNMKLEEAYNQLGITLTGDGWYVMDGCHYETIEYLLQTGILGFCGCGDPYETIIEVARALQNVKVMEMEHLSLFMRYFLDSKGLTEHGVSINYAWITQKGEAFIALADTLEEDL